MQLADVDELGLAAVDLLLCFLNGQPRKRLVRILHRHDGAPFTLENNPELSISNVAYRALPNPGRAGRHLDATIRT
jgi:hypothetical protein